MIREAEAKDREAIERLYKILIPGNENILVLEERINQIKASPNNYLFVFEQ